MMNIMTTIMYFDFVLSIVMRMYILYHKKGGCIIHPPLKFYLSYKTICRIFYGHIFLPSPPIIFKFNLKFSLPYGIGLSNFMT